MTIKLYSEDLAFLWDGLQIHCYSLDNSKLKSKCLFSGLLIAERSSCSNAVWLLLILLVLLLKHLSFKLIDGSQETLEARLTQAFSSIGSQSQQLSKRLVSAFFLVGAET